MSEVAVSLNAAPAVDQVRLIRRSMRCFVFGLIGAIPVVGIGVATQALRLGSNISADTGVSMGRRDFVYGYWLGAWVIVPACGWLAGWPAAVLVWWLFAGVQSIHIWRRFRGGNSPVWNPAFRYVRWGTVLAYAGVFNSLLALELLFFLMVWR